MILSALLIALASAAKAIMDLSAEGKLKWKPSDYWLKNDSWFRKWKPPYGLNIERWPTSSTITCFLTDAWHLAQFIFLACVFALPFTWQMITPYWILDFIIIRIAFGLLFEFVFYRPLKKG